MTYIGADNDRIIYEGDFRNGEKSGRGKIYFI